MSYKQLDLNQLRVFPLSERKSLTSIEDIIIDPNSSPPDAGEYKTVIDEIAKNIIQAKQNNASVMLAYGAHLLRNGMGPTIIRLMEEGWLTHAATNGAGIIHDWEYSYHGKSTESVRENAPAGTFGTWDETGKCINLAVTHGVTENRGFGESIGRFIQDDGVDIPSVGELEELIQSDPRHSLTAARSDFLRFLESAQLSKGQFRVQHPWKQYSVPGNAFRIGVPFTVHPGIGYDIFSNHPLFTPAAVGRGGGIDFRIFAQSVLNLSGGVFISVGSAIMSPQVFEKCMSCANNILLQNNQCIKNHKLYIIDLQDGGGWDWKEGEPPKTNPAYYLRFCKSFARMGGELEYLCMDNRLFMHNLYSALREYA
jgi:hypothetical protein